MHYQSMLTRASQLPSPDPNQEHGGFTRNPVLGCPAEPQRRRSGASGSMARWVDRGRWREITSWWPVSNEGAARSAGSGAFPPTDRRPHRRAQAR